MMKKLYVLICVLLAIVSAVAAVIYFTKTAGQLPHFFPGYIQASSIKHVKHGIGCAGLAVVFLLGAWMLKGKKKASPPTENTAS